MPPAGQWRWIDAALSSGIVALSFSAGVLYQRVSALEATLTTRGGPAISVEAAQRIATLESRMDRCERMLDR